MKPDLKPIDRQVIVITGASSGIGLATARLAADRGARLVLVARSENTLRDIVDEINAADGDAVYMVADVADREQLRAAAEGAIARYGRIDTWVNDAGVSIYGRLDEVSDADSRRLFDVNFWGIVNGSLVALPYLCMHGGGTLINVGSEASETAVPLQGMYSASKHAVKGFTDALRIELVEVDKAPVSITLIQPTAVNTPYPQHARNYTDQEPRMPTPNIDPFDVAAAILHAATHIERDIKVGMAAHVDTLLTSIAPGLAERMMAKLADSQHYEEAPRDPEGTLYRAGGTGMVHGAGGRTSH